MCYNMSPVGVEFMNYDNNISINSLSDDEIIKGVLPVVNEVFEQYFFVPCSNENKKEILKKIIRISRIGYNSNESYLSYFRRNLSLYLDDYIKFMFHKKSKTSIVLLNKYLESLRNVNSYDDALYVINKLIEFSSRYDYTINKYMVFRLLEYSNKFVTIANYCVKEKSSNDNYLYKIMIFIMIIIVNVKHLLMLILKKLLIYLYYLLKMKKN